MSLKRKDRRAILSAAESEGFEYAFVHYSAFPEVVDPEFHRLRTAYIAARLTLADYIGYSDES